MPLTSIRPVLCGKYITPPTKTITEQIIHHLTYSQKEYHDIFSDPEKWFSIGLLSPNSAVYIAEKFPDILNTTKDYYIDFLFNSCLWSHIPFTTPFTERNWDTIMCTYPVREPMVDFIEQWIKQLEISIQKERVKELTIRWKTWYWNTLPQKRALIMILNRFGEIGKESCSYLRNEYSKENLESMTREFDKIYKKREMSGYTSETDTP